jgi:hypothetical protein
MRKFGYLIFLITLFLIRSTVIHTAIKIEANAGMIANPPEQKWEK